MFSMSMDLFGDQKWIGDVGEARIRLVNSTVDRAELDGLDQLQDSLMAQHRFDVPRLVRSAAKFDVDDSGTRVSVTVTIPVQGDEMLLKHRVRQGGPRRHISAHVTDSARWSGLESAAEDEGAIKLDKMFPAGTDSAAIREWARGEVDYIEATLKQMGEITDEFNRQLPNRIADRINERRSVLTQVDSLARDLGTGI